MLRLGVELLDGIEQSQSVHLRHINVGQHHADFLVGLQRLQGFEAVVREEQLVFAATNQATKTLAHHQLQVWLVVHN